MAKSNKTFRLPIERLNNLQRHVEQKTSKSAHLGTERIVDIPMDLLDSAPWNTRRHFDEASIQKLAEDIQAHGLIHPIIARPKGERFEIVAGERRYRAIKHIGLPTIKANVRPLEDTEAYQIALLENLSREDLNPYEETVGYLQLLALKLKEFPYFQELGRGDPSEQETAIKILNRFWNEKKRSAHRGTNNVISQRVSDTEIEEVIINVFKDLGKMTWESFFQNRLPLLRLPKDVVSTLHEGSMPYTKARLIAKVQDAEARKTLMEETTSQGLSVTQLRKRIKTFRSDDEIEQIANRLSSVAKKFRHSQVLRDKKKRRKIIRLLDELENYATSSLL